MNVSATTAQSANSPDESLEVHGVVDRLLRMEETRHRNRVNEIRKVATIIARIASEPSQVPVDVAIAVASRRLVHSPIKCVKRSVKKFGATPFTLDELCARIETEFPDLGLSRPIVSRRLYELRNGSNPIVETVACSQSEGDLIDHSKEKQRLYRYVGPP